MGVPLLFFVLFVMAMSFIMLLGRYFFHFTM
jgi:hypothetical protein